MPARRSTSTVPACLARGRGVLAALATAAALTLVLLGTGMHVARAHDEVVATTPARDAVVAASPQRVELQLTRPAQALGTRVLVSGPDGAPVSQGPAELAGTTVAQPLAADLPSGRYTVEWQVTSADGHPISGTSTFAVAGAAGASTLPDEGRAGPAAPGGAVTDPAARTAGDDAGPWWSRTAWIALGASVVIAVGGLGARQLSRRR
jgi:copper resistance protein C